jgi:outer membrane protein assembly factor BamA
MRPKYNLPILFFFLLAFGTNTQVLCQYIAVDTLIFKGNERTKLSILRRELDFFERDSLKVSELADRIEFNRRKLMNTNLFIWVKSDYHQLPNGRISIIYEFLEQWYVLAYPLFQLADRNFNDWWSRGKDFDRASYGLNFKHNNFMGRNEKLILKAETGFNNKFEFTYQNPYLDRKKTIGLLLNWQYASLKNVPYKTISDTLAYVKSNLILAEKWTTTIQLRKRFRFYDFQSIEFKYTHANIDKRVAQLNPAYFGQSQSIQNFSQLGYIFSYDFRDFINYPLMGRKIDVSFTKFGLSAKENVDFWEASASAAYFFDLGSKFFFATNVKAKVSRDTYIAYANQRGFGYANDLVRGYELNVIDGTGFFLWRNTAKFQLFSKILRIPFLPYKQLNQVPIAIYPTAFADIGYVFNPFQEPSINSNKWLFGTGLGFDFVTYYNFVARIGFPVINGGKTGMVVALGREF